MAEITCFSSVGAVLGACRIDEDTANKWQYHRGASVLRYNDDESCGQKIKHLLATGVAKERIGWVKVSQSYMIVVRNG